MSWHIDPTTSDLFKDERTGVTISAVISEGLVKVTAFTVWTPDETPLPDEDVPPDIQKTADWLASFALAAEAFPDAPPEDPRGWLDHMRGRLDTEKAIEKHMKATRKRTDWTPGRLKELAGVYVAAVNDGRPPRQACADHFGVAPQTASRAIRLARDAGYLTEPGKDQTDAKA